MHSKTQSTRSAASLLHWRQITHVFEDSDSRSTCLGQLGFEMVLLFNTRQEVNLNHISSVCH